MNNWQCTKCVHSQAGSMSSESRSKTFKTVILMEISDQSSVCSFVIEIVIYQLLIWQFLFCLKSYDNSWCNIAVLQNGWLTNWEWLTIEDKLLIAFVSSIFLHRFLILKVLPEIFIHIQYFLAKLCKLVSVQWSWTKKKDMVNSTLLITLWINFILLMIEGWQHNEIVVEIALVSRTSINISVSCF